MNSQDVHSTAIEVDQPAPPATDVAQVEPVPATQGRRLSLLVVKDSQDEIDEMLLALRQGGIDPVWERVETTDALRVALSGGHWDAVVSEYTLPNFGAEAALEVVRSCNADLPFIIISGAVGEDAAVALMRATASDYILKHNLVRLAPTVEREVRVAGNRRARRDAERAATYLAAVVESSDDAILSTTLDGVIVTWNQAAEDLYGWTAAEAIGRDIAFVIPPDKTGELSTQMARLLAGESVGYVETVRVHRSGELLDVAMIISRVRDADGRLIGVSKTARNIRARKQTEAALRESEARYRGLLESIPTLVWVYDAAGRVLMHNRRWYEYTGQTVEDTAAGRWHEALHPDDAARALAEWTRCVASGEPYSIEYRLRRADGTYRWFLAQGTAQQASGSIDHWVGTCTDIDDQKRATGRLSFSESRYRRLFEAAQDGILIVDPVSCTVIEANPLLAKLIGYRREEVVGKKLWEIGLVEDAAAIAATFQTLQEKGYVRYDDRPLRANDGRRIDVEFVCNVYEEGGDRVIQCNIRDITDRRRAEAAERLSEERFRAFMDHSPAATFIKNAEGQYLYVNPTWLQQFDPQPVHWEGKSDHDFWPRETADLFRASDLACQATDAIIQLEETGRTLAGSEATWLVTKFPLAEGKRLIGGMAWDISDRKRAEEALRLRDRAMHAATQGLVITDPNRPDDPIVYLSPGFERMTGYASEEVIDRNCRFLQGKATDPAAVKRLRDAIRAGEACTVEFLNYRKDGTTFWNELSVSPVREADGRLTHFVGVLADVSGRRELQEQFRQAQKMDAFGQLAGGVAHDFNNLLTIINGYSNMLLEDLPAGDPSRELIAEILKAGERSAGLTRQLLAFSRQQVLAPQVLSLNEVVTDTGSMLRRLIGEDVRLATFLGPGLWPVRADPGQVEQVLMNLAVNARDAMPTGGRLTLETRNVELDDSYCDTHPEARSGPHVVLSVADTGCGIPPEVVARVFEPFFTTKGPGRGTGLGLATVHGIVLQSGGHVAVYSEVGVGTTLKVYLPEAELEPAGDSRTRPVVLSVPRGTETVLLTEDEAAVRSLARRVLAGCGYTVLEAADGDEAARVAAEYGRPIDLLVTDVVMPGLGGRAVAKRVAESHPSVRVLFISGYTDDAVIRHGVLTEGVNYLQKPFTPTALAHKVREVLDGRPLTWGG
jgi:two-component system cell cycle sensor histidine kinase/response regulator CckA